MHSAGTRAPAPTASFAKLKASSVDFEFLAQPSHSKSHKKAAKTRARNAAWARWHGAETEADSAADDSKADSVVSEDQAHAQDCDHNHNHDHVHETKSRTDEGSESKRNQRARAASAAPAEPPRNSLHTRGFRHFRQALSDDLLRQIEQKLQKQNVRMEEQISGEHEQSFAEETWNALGEDLRRELLPQLGAAPGFPAGMKIALLKKLRAAPKSPAQLGHRDSYRRWLNCIVKLGAGSALATQFTSTKYTVAELGRHGKPHSSCWPLPWANDFEETTFQRGDFVAFWSDCLHRGPPNPSKSTAREVLFVALVTEGEEVPYDNAPVFAFHHASEVYGFGSRMHIQYLQEAVDTAGYDVLRIHYNDDQRKKLVSLLRIHRPEAARR